MLDTLLDGRYKIIKTLSKGGFGQTYIAEDTRRPGNPQCVVKHLKPASQDTQFIQVSRRLFTKEAEILEKLGQYPQIPQLLAYFEIDREFYLVQELIVGTALSDEIPHNSRLSEIAVRKLLHDVLTTLVFVHGHQVIHRDIKPSNLIRRWSDDRYVLIDFGAVKEIQAPRPDGSGLSQITIGIGTHGYMPAEQIAGRPRFSSDLYALGMVAIRALTGIEPTHLPEDPATGELNWHCYTAVSAELVEILNRMTLPHFGQRYSSAQEVLQDLQRIDAMVPPPTLPVAIAPHDSLAPHDSRDQHAPTLMDLPRTEFPPTSTPPTVAHAPSAVVLLDKGRSLWFRIGGLTLGFVAIFSAFRLNPSNTLPQQSLQPAPLTLGSSLTLERQDVVIPFTRISLEPAKAPGYERFASLVVPDTDTTHLAFGNQIRRYDVHVAKMIELSHHFHCAEPYTNGVEKAVVWDYRADSGRIKMGLFRLRCTQVKESVAIYGLGPPETTEVRLAGQDPKTVSIPTLNLQGNWKVSHFLDFVQTLKPQL